MKRLQVLYWVAGLSVFLLAGCQQAPEACSPQSGTVPINVELLANSEELPVQFPLDEYVVGYFHVKDSSGVFANLIHAAEDYHLPPGTPVYAVADGVISFSGPMAGYGWLIIVDHPQVNVYSLYGHLSPSRWKRGTGRVEKGELIAYIGDSHENGSSDTYGTMKPHLHFAVRSGQRINYLRFGDSRWQAGWTGACPESIGWLKPSKFISDYAGGSFVTSSIPYQVARFVVIFYTLGGLWLIGLGCIIILAVLMTWQLKQRNRMAAGLLRRLLPWMNLGQYRRVMLEETGHPGPLYTTFLICVFLTSLAALGLMVTFRMLG